MGRHGGGNDREGREGHEENEENLSDSNDPIRACGLLSVFARI